MSCITEIDLAHKLTGIRGWEIHDDRIIKTYGFDEDMKALDFLNQLAIVATHSNMRPEIMLSGSQVKVSIVIGEEGELSERDFSLAKRAEQLAVSVL